MTAHPDYPQPGYPPQPTEPGVPDAPAPRPVLFVAVEHSAAHCSGDTGPSRVNAHPAGPN